MAVLLLLTRQEQRSGVCRLCNLANRGQIVVTVVGDDVVVTTCTAARDGLTLNRLEDTVVLN